MLFGSKRAFCVAIDGYDARRTEHLELEVRVRRNNIEFGERSPAEEGVIATAKRCNIEDQVLASEIIRRSKHYLKCHDARAAGLHSRNDPLKGGLTGLILDGSIPIFLIVSLYIRLRLLPPSIRTLVRWNPSIMGSSTKAADPQWRMLVG